MLAVAAPPGALFDKLDEVALSVTPLRVGRAVRLPVLVTDAVRDARFTPVALERVAVPAGTFDAYRVEVRGYPGVAGEPDVLQVWYLTAERPHRVVRQELPAQRLEAVAVEVR